MLEMFIKKIGISPDSAQAVVMLKEKHGERVLSIWVGPVECRAIISAFGHKEIEPPTRPQTHDLLLNTINATGYKINKLEITNLADSTFFARLCLSAENQQLDIDCRPSDGIAVALRQGAPILVSPTVLDDAGRPEHEVVPQDDTESFKRFIEQVKASDFPKLPLSNQPDEGDKEEPDHS